MNYHFLNRLPCYLFVVNEFSRFIFTRRCCFKGARSIDNVDTRDLKFTKRLKQISLGSSKL